MAFLVAGLSLSAARMLASLPIPTTSQDFLEPGTQPNGLNQSIQSSANCQVCHGNYDVNQEPYTRWSTSMMAQAMRDPVFHAALAVAEQDAPSIGGACIRCHSPGGWLEGRSTPSDGSALTGKDYEGNIGTASVNIRIQPLNDPNAPSVSWACTTTGSPSMCEEASRV